MEAPLPDRAGFIYTFYSYKGGTGRSMALANVAALLSRGGKKVLVVDWDLEAPGLEKYLANIEPAVVQKRTETDGIVDLIANWIPAHDAWRPRYEEWLGLDKVRQEARSNLRRAQQELTREKGAASERLAELTRTRDAAEVEWRHLDTQMSEKYADGAPRPVVSDWKRSVISLTPFQGGAELHFISAGRADDTYPNRVNGLRWGSLFTTHELGLMLEQLRSDWKRDYDFVLIDSRTGISDIEGICTVLLPDSLVLLFTTMRQSVEGVIDVWEHAVKQRDRLPVPRGQLLALPLPSRDEVDREHRLAGEWHELFAASFAKIYQQWLPEGVTPLEVVKQTALPYAAVWSFGERLPVVESEADLKNPRSVNAAYDRVAGLLANRLSWTAASSAVTTIGLSKSQRESAPLPAPEPAVPTVDGGYTKYVFLGLTLVASAAAVVFLILSVRSQATVEELRNTVETHKLATTTAQAGWEQEKAKSADFQRQLEDLKNAPNQASIEELTKQRDKADADYRKCESRRGEAERECIRKTEDLKTANASLTSEKERLNRQLMQLRKTGGKQY